MRPSKRKRLSTSALFSTNFDIHVSIRISNIVSQHGQVQFRRPFWQAFLQIFQRFLD